MSNFEMISLYLLALILAFLLPLIPTIVTYKLSPEDKSFATGPLQGLQIRVAGTFATYIIGLVILIPFSTPVMERIATMKETIWIIEGKLEYKDSNGELLAPRPDMRLATLLQPERSSAIASDYRIVIPSDTFENLPRIRLDYNDWGGATINLKDYEEYIVRKGQLITINTPITIKEHPVFPEGSSISTNSTNVNHLTGDPTINLELPTSNTPLQTTPTTEGGQD